MILPALGALVGIVSGVVGVASTVQGLSSQAATKKDIKRRNLAAETANKELREITNKSNKIIKQINTSTQNFFEKKKAAIDEGNESLAYINDSIRAFTETANQQIGKANEERKRQSSLVRNQERLNTARNNRELIREAVARSAGQLNISSQVGALRSSSARGGISSIQSQLAAELGFSSQQTAISDKVFEASQGENEALFKAQQAQNEGVLARFDADVLKRDIEVELVSIQNEENLKNTKQQNTLSLQQNRADKIREFAQQDPEGFLESRNVEFSSNEVETILNSQNSNQDNQEVGEAAKVIDPVKDLVKKQQNLKARKAKAKEEGNTAKAKEINTKLVETRADVKKARKKKKKDKS